MSNIGNIFVGNCENVTLRNIIVKNNSLTPGRGIYIYSSNNIILENINASNNYHGIQLKDSDYCTIEYSNVTDNTYDGIFLDPSNYNNISNVFCNLLFFW